MLKERFSIGLDIGTSTVKFVKLKFSKETVELCGFDLQPSLPVFIEVLRKIKESQDMQSVNIAVSGPSTIIRYVIFPDMNETELKQALKFEASRHIPFSINEVNLDGHILKHNLPDNKMMVLVAAVKKEFLNQRLKMLQDSGLTVKLVDMDSLAIVNAFNFNYANEELKGKTQALLNIGAVETSLNILEDGLPLLSRDIHLGGNNITQKIQDALAIDFKTAEELKLKADKDRLDKLHSAIESALSSLSSEIRTSFDYYESQSASSVEKILLSGGGSLFLGLKDILANLLGIAIEYWDPLKELTISSDIDSQRIKMLSPQLAVPIGLALRQ